MGHTEYLADGGIFDPNAEAQAAVIDEIGRKLADAAAAFTANMPPAPPTIATQIIAPAVMVDVAACAAAPVCPPCAAPGPLDFYYALVRGVNWADKLMNVLTLLFILTMAYWAFVAIRYLLRMCSKPPPEDSPRTAGMRASQLMQIQLATRR